MSKELLTVAEQIAAQESMLKATAARERPNPFETIPDIISERGRVKGFEKLRDVLLRNWTNLAGVISPYNLIKLVLETDRHVLFSELSALKTKGEEGDPKWKEFREYLQRGDLPKGDDDGKGIGQEEGSSETGGARGEDGHSSGAHPRRRRPNRKTNAEASGVGVQGKADDVRPVGEGRGEGPRR